MVRKEEAYMDRIVKRIDPSLPAQPKLVRAAGYARVSSGKDAMLHSLSAQISYYSELIQKHPGWSYCGVYADEAMTGTKDNRESFQRLITDCRAGKIDMVITKSISRFARNTLTLLSTVRELKELGVDVFFEEQNIHTLSADGELMLTILASYAQEESRSASENKKWQIRRSYEKGEDVQWHFQYGYTITKDDVKINPKQAEIVKEIFRRAIDGETFGSIARDLNERGDYTFFGNKWTHCRITEVLSDIRYTGDAILQKTFVNNHIEKKVIKNQGELPKYYAEGSHDAIIDKDTFEKAQEVLKRVREKHPGGKRNGPYPFSSMIKCGACGSNFKRITINGRTFWNCRSYQDAGKNKCHSKRIPETTLESTAAEVLGLDAFDEEVFKAQIERIDVPSANRLIFVFKDGRIEERTWKDRSRAESWTPEMREAARQRSLNQKGKKK
jgi:site-specific DNA recombinase